MKQFRKLLNTLLKSATRARQFERLSWVELCIEEHREQMELWDALQMAGSHFDDHPVWKDFEKSAWDAWHGAK